MSGYKYKDGHVFDTGVQLVKRLYKDKYCENNNIHLLRITYKDKNKINDEYIMNLLNSLF